MRGLSISSHSLSLLVTSQGTKDSYETTLGAKRIIADGIIIFEETQVPESNADHDAACVMETAFPPTSELPPLVYLKPTTLQLLNRYRAFH